MGPTTPADRAAAYARYVDRSPGLVDGVNFF